MGGRTDGLTDVRTERGTNRFIGKTTSSLTDITKTRIRRQAIAREDESDVELDPVGQWSYREEKILRI
jgi:hypothetical protein